MSSPHRRYGIQNTFAGVCAGRGPFETLTALPRLPLLGRFNPSHTLPSCCSDGIFNMTVPVTPDFSKLYFEILRTIYLEHFTFLLLATSSVIFMLIDLLIQIMLHAVDFDSNVLFIYSALGDRGSTVVKVLCYKSEVRWFDPSWCQWNFSLA